MIVSKTPYRISFFGGGTDYPSWYLKNGGSVLSTTIDKHIYISCRYLPPFFEHKYRIVWTHIENVKKMREIKHRAVREMLKHFKVNSGLEIHYDGDLPAKSGMGSSSVFVVGLMHLLNNFTGKKISKKLLAQQSVDFEQNVLKDVVGSQDQIAAAYGGLNKISFNTNGSFNVKSLKIKEKVKKKLSKNLLLIYTGFKRTAHDIASGYVNKLHKEKKSYILRISKLAEEAENSLKLGDPKYIWKLIARVMARKKGLSSSITNSSIDEIYDKAIKNGAIGGKLLGAGGGGFFFILCTKF